MCTNGIKRPITKVQGPCDICPLTHIPPAVNPGEILVSFLNLTTIASLSPINLTPPDEPTMSIHPKPQFFILLLLLTSLIISAYSSSPDADAEPNQPGSDEESDDLEQLLAVDEQLQQDLPPHHHHQQSEAETVSKAQRIVLELSGDNAKRVIGGNEFVMVLGYAPWCARSADLMPKFSEAATDLKEIGSPVVMAKVDGDRYSKAASEMEIRGFPTLLLFVNGTSQPYTGGFSA